MKKEPSEKDGKTSYKVDVKDFTLNQPVGGSEKVYLKKSVSVALDEENALKAYFGNLILTMLDVEILAQFEVDYTADTICARCLEKFKRDGSISFENVYKLGRRIAEEGESVVDKDFMIEIGIPIFEEIMLDIPMKALCSEDCKGLTKNNQ